MEPEFDTLLPLSEVADTGTNLVRMAVAGEWLLVIEQPPDFPSGNRVRVITPYGFDEMGLPRAMDQNSNDAATSGFAQDFNVLAADASGQRIFAVQDDETWELTINGQVRLQRTGRRAGRRGSSRPARRAPPLTRSRFTLVEQDEAALALPEQWLPEPDVKAVGLPPRDW